MYIYRTTVCSLHLRGNCFKWNPTISHNRTATITLLLYIHYKHLKVEMLEEKLLYICFIVCRFDIPAIKWRHRYFRRLGPKSQSWEDTTIEPTSFSLVYGSDVSCCEICPLLETLWPSGIGCRLLRNFSTFRKMVTLWRAKNSRR